MLDCCQPIEVTKVKGITLPKLACLARCNGATVCYLIQIIQIKIIKIKIQFYLYLYFYLCL